MKLRNWGAAALMCALSTTALAQRAAPQLSDAVSSVPVELLPPGARALGLAGAFTAVADDATAAEANPAGLTILRDPEVSVHFRDTDNTIRYFDPEARNPEEFAPANVGQLIKRYEDSSSNVSFASVVYPWEKFVFSAFYTNNLDLSAVTPSETSFDAQFLDTFISDNSLAGELEGYGLSFAYRFNDKFSLGVTVKRQELSISSLDRQIVRGFRDFEFVFANATGLPADQFAAVLQDEFIISNSLAGDGSDTVFNIGMLLRPNDKWSFGLTYKDGGSYDIPAVNTFQQSLGCVDNGTAQFDTCQLGFDGIDLSPFNMTEQISQLPSIGVPDTFTLGVAYRPNDTLLFSLDINNIDYSDLPQPRRTTLGFNFPVDGTGTMDVGSDDIEPIGDDVSYHFGVEKVFFPNSSWFNVFTLRGGAFTDDDHDGTRLIDTDDTHYTIGIGGVFNERFQVDLAGEFSDRVDNIVLSAIYRFQ